jgi:hypothetical protein
MTPWRFSWGDKKASCVIFNHVVLITGIAFKTPPFGVFQA